MMIVMVYDSSRDDDNSSSDMNDMIFRSTTEKINILKENKENHDISHLLELHDEVLMVVMMAIMII